MVDSKPRPGHPGDSYDSVPGERLLSCICTSYYNVTRNLSINLGKRLTVFLVFFSPVFQLGTYHERTGMSEVENPDLTSNSTLQQRSISTTTMVVWVVLDGRGD